MTIRRTLFLALAAAAALAGAGRPARADSRVEVGNGDKVTGSFVPQDETETFTFFVPAGARISATAKGKKKKGSATPRVTAVLSDPDGSPMPGATPVGGGTKFTSVETVATGRHSLALTSNAAGDYTFSVKWKLPSVVRDVLSFGGGDQQTTSLSADRGSSITVSVSRAKGSAALPRVLSVDAADFSWSSDPIDPPANFEAPSHVVRNLRLGGEGGEYLVLIGDDSGEGGDVNVTVTVTPPRGKPRKVDISTRQTGADPANQFGLGAVIGPEGGGIEVDDGLSSLAGAAVSIPPGAMGNPAVILITSDGNVVPPGNPGGPSGPAVGFGPDGMQFGESETGDPVFVTIPFDPEQFDGDFDALEIYVKDSKGKVTLVTPKSDYVIDPENATVTFPVSHFSTYQAFGPERPTRTDLDDDGFDDLVVGSSDGASGAGRVWLLRGRSDFSKKPPTGFDAHFDGGTGLRSFGRATAVGDLNGDGVADLAVSALTAPSGPPKVLVFYGGSGFAPDASAPDAVVTGLSAQTELSFGTHIAIGDVTGDGAPDLVVGAPDTGANSPADGAVFVFAGGSGFGTTDTGGSGVVRLDGVRGEGLGIAFAFGRLLGDDAFDDLVVSSRNGPVGLNSGTIHLIPGGSGLASGIAESMGPDYTGDIDGDELGRSLAVADIDADGLDDVIAGTPGGDAIGEFDILDDSGTVLVFLGGGLDGGGGAVADYEIEGGAEAFARRGSFVAAGQFVGRLIADIAFGEPGRQASAGAVGFVPGDREDPTVVTLAPRTASSEEFGALLAGTPDLNRDGRDDLSVIAPAANGGAGRLVIHLGRAGASPVVTIAAPAGESLGR